MTFNGLIQLKLAHSRSIIKICALIFIETNKKEILRMCKMVYVCMQYMDVTGNVFLMWHVWKSKKCNKGIKDAIELNTKKDEMVFSVKLKLRMYIAFTIFPIDKRPYKHWKEYWVKDQIVILESIKLQIDNLMLCYVSFYEEQNITSIRDVNKIYKCSYCINQNT